MANTDEAVDEEVPPALRPPPTPTFVRDLDHLRLLVQDDEGLSLRARQLEQKRARAAKVGWGSILGGAALVVAGFALMKEAPDDCTSACWAELHPASGPLMISGGVIAIGGGLIGHLLAPKREDSVPVIKAWNNQHPQQPLELLRPQCSDRAKNCDDRPFPLPDELQANANVLVMRGRSSVRRKLSFGDWSCVNLEVGLRRHEFSTRRKTYKDTLTHQFSTWVVGGTPWHVKCHERKHESGKYKPGSKWRIDLSGFIIKSDEPPTFTPLITSYEMKCTIASEQTLEFEMNFWDDVASEGIVVKDANGNATPIAIKRYDTSIINSFWRDDTTGFALHWDDKLGAIVDLENGGRVAMRPELSPSVRDRVAAVIVALTLWSDRGRAPTSSYTSNFAW